MPNFHVQQEQHTQAQHNGNKYCTQQRRSRSRAGRRPGPPLESGYPQEHYAHVSKTNCQREIVGVILSAHDVSILHTHVYPKQ